MPNGEKSRLVVDDPTLPMFANGVLFLGAQCELDIISGIEDTSIGQRLNAAVGHAE